VVGPRLRDKVIALKTINECVCCIRLKLKFFIISVICCHSPTEDAEDVDKDAFYEAFGNAYDQCASHDIKVFMVTSTVK
jgi:hypothetical protein